jgi:CheY-specific phosphatase CheX
MSCAVGATLDHEIATVVQVVEQRTISFMRDQLQLVPSAVSRRLSRADTIKLREVTAMVGVGARAGLYVAYSYDDGLIRTMMRRYTAELSIAPEEEELYVRETASDIVNVIIGNCTADLAKRGETMSLSPPVLMVGARTIQIRAETVGAVLTLQFPEGVLDLVFVGPKILFDDQLNYSGELSS